MDSKKSRDIVAKQLKNKIKTLYKRYDQNMDLIVSLSLALELAEKDAFSYWDKIRKLKGSLSKSELGDDAIRH